MRGGATCSAGRRRSLLLRAELLDSPAGTSSSGGTPTRRSSASRAAAGEDELRTKSTSFRRRRSNERPTCCVGTRFRANRRDDRFRQGRRSQTFACGDRGRCCRCERRRGGSSWGKRADRDPIRFQGAALRARPILCWTWSRFRSEASNTWSARPIAREGNKGLGVNKRTGCLQRRSGARSDVGAIAGGGKGAAIGAGAGAEPAR